VAPTTPSDADRLVSWVDPFEMPDDYEGFEDEVSDDE